MSTAVILNDLNNRWTTFGPPTISEPDSNHHRRNLNK
jgi:hypothetical protein